MKKIISSIKIFLFLLFTSIKTIEAEILKCHFRTTIHTSTTAFYTCFVQNNKIFRLSRANIDAIDGPHAINKTHEDVQALSILSIYNIKFLPTNIENSFGNIILLQIWNTDYDEIHQQDLKGFRKLKYLFLSNNQLQIIEAGLFAFNVELEFIWLNFNKITQIYSFAFSHLSKLRSLKLFSNECLNVDKMTRSDVIELVKRIESGECSSNETEITVNSENEINQLKRQNEILKFQNEEMSQNMTSLNDEMKKQTVKYDDLIIENEKLKNNFNQMLMTIEQKNNELKSLNEMSTATIQRISADKEQMRLKNEKLERNVESLTNTVTKLTKSFQQLQANYGTLIRRMRENLQNFNATEIELN